MKAEEIDRTRDSANLEKTDYQLTVAILSQEYAIGTRTGGFCAHPYLIRLFGVSSDHVHQLRDEVSCGGRRSMPGAVRISFGSYTTREDVDAAVDALWEIPARHLARRLPAK